jgi:hypothetical protein
MRMYLGGYLIDILYVQDLLSAFGSEGGDEDQRLSVLIGGSSE